LGIEKYEALVPVIAVKPETFTVELDPFVSVIKTDPDNPVTFAGLGVATSALLPVPLTGIKKGLPDAPV
jgi:hypothetical protein